jgi:hypothetical protein
MRRALARWLARIWQPQDEIVLYTDIELAQFECCRAIARMPYDDEQ